MHRRILIGSIGSLLALSVGCSDDPATNNDASTADVVTTTDIGTSDAGFPDTGRADSGVTDTGPRDVPVATDAVDAGGTDVPAMDGGAACALTRALVTTSDYVMGGYALGPIAPPALTVTGTMSPDQDHIPVQSGCLVYNLLRDNDVLAVLNPTALPAIARRIPLRAVMTGDAGTADAGPPRGYQINPYDVLTLSATRALVVQYAVPRIAIVNPTVDGAGGVTGSIDLAPLRQTADTDGAPEASNVLRIGNSIFVSLQNLDNYNPVTNGTIAVINATDLSLVDADTATTGLQPLRLTGRNPVSMVATPAGTSIVVAEAGLVTFIAPQTLDGRIERVNPTTLAVVGTGVSETALGGDVSGVVMLDENRGWAVVTRLAVADASVADARVVEFDLAAGTAGRTIVTTGSIGGIARDPSGNVWVLDRSATGAGVRVFRPDGTALTAMTIGTGAQPPFGIAFVP